MKPVNFRRTDSREKGAGMRIVLSVDLTIQQGKLLLNFGDQDRRLDGGNRVAKIVVDTGAETGLNFLRAVGRVGRDTKGCTCNE